MGLLQLQKRPSQAQRLQAQSSLSINVAPVADAPAVSVPSSSTSSPIKIGENINNDAYEAIRLNVSVSEINTSDYAENLEIIIRMPHGTGGASFELILNGGDLLPRIKCPQVMIY